MNQYPKPFERYKHFKGGLYQVLTIAKDSESGEDMVVYQGLYEPYQIYVRPVKMFIEDVDKTKYPECEQKKRFQLEQHTESMGYSIEESPIEETPIEEKPIEEAPGEIEEKLLEGTVNPDLARFLDAVGEEEKLNVLFEIKNQLTPEILIPMELSLGMEPQDTTVEERYRGIKTLLLTKQKYERHRL